MRKAIFAGVVAGSLIAATGAGAATYLALDKDVTISIDGKERQVSTFAGTVGDVLAEEGIRYGERDVVAPSPTADLSDGTRIAVRYARPLRLTVDGKPGTHWTTETKVATALDQLGLRFEGAELSASRSAGIAWEGLSLEVATNKHVTILHDGGRTMLQTTGLRVEEALADAAIELGPEDVVKPRVTAPLDDGDRIRVIRVVTKNEKTKVEIPYDTVREANSQMYDDEEKTAREGENGVKVVTRKVRYVDGKKVSSKVVDTEVVKEPVDEVIHYGTMERPVEEPEDDGGSGGDDGGDDGSDDGDSGGSGGNTGTDADSLNWAALAQCESGGNPRAVNPAGYYGLYQFSLSTWASVGGSGNPIDASPEEQTYRAKLLYDRAGAGQWPYCGQFLFS